MAPRAIHLRRAGPWHTGGVTMALILLLAAVWLAHQGARWPLAVGAALLAAAWAGTTLPDVDLALGLGHRSGLTHSVLPAAVASYRRRWWPVAAGLALGIGLHLSADLFPNAMRGYATMKLPGAGAIGADESYLWIAVNAALALAAGAWLAFAVTGARLATVLLAGVALIGVGYLFRTDGGWWALGLFAALGWLVWRGRAAIVQ